jgi:hypothetical protein
MNLAACGGMFFDRINTINKIFLFSLYPEHPVYPVKKWDLYYQVKMVAELLNATLQSSFEELGKLKKARRRKGI